MIFTLEALEARFGDSLLLHYGTADQPCLIVIDGGPPGVYKEVLRNRLEEIRKERSPRHPLPIEMVMISHIDGDHIAGILEWMQEMDDLDEEGHPLPYRIARFWHNSFDDILGNDSQELFSHLDAAVRSVSTEAALPADLPLHRDSAVVAASVPQSRKLRDLVRKLSLGVNTPYRGLVMAPATGAGVVDLGEGLSFVVVGPREQRVQELQAEWALKLQKIQAKPSSAASVEAAAFLDKSVFNLSSIIVLAKLGGRQMLLTGDARGDDILHGLQGAGLLDAEGKLHVDLLKVPHHGSDRNVSTDFFTRITAEQYVISANGEHNNPDIPTLNMLSQARPDDRFTLYLTNFEERLGEFFEAERAEAAGTESCSGTTATRLCAST